MPQIAEVKEKPVELSILKGSNTIEIDDDGSLWNTLIYKGMNYGVTNSMNAKPFSMFWNRHWLDKPGLKLPETLEEYEEVLTAFVEQDPYENGKKEAGTEPVV